MFGSFLGFCSSQVCRIELIIIPLDLYFSHDRFLIPINISLQQLFFRPNKGSLKFISFAKLGIGEKIFFLVEKVGIGEKGVLYPHKLIRYCPLHLCIVCFITFLTIYKGKFCFGQFYKNGGREFGGGG